MKKISKFILKESAEILEKDEMKLILGGSTYKCCCGMGSNTGPCINVTADNTDIIFEYDIIYNLCSQNGGHGMGGCFY